MKNICLWLLCLMIATGAQADGDDALRRFVVNAGHVGLKMSLPISQLRVQPTLVTGIYALSAPNGDFAGYINEAGSLHGDARGFKHVMPQWRDLTPAETADLRAAVLAAIDTRHLPQITYGDGGGRRILLFSAIDCPACSLFEDTMRRYEKSMNTSLIVVPSSLQDIEKGGHPKWQIVARIMCADDPGTAWQAFWRKTKNRTSLTPSCSYAQAEQAEHAYDYLRNILNAVGVSVSGTPTFVREDGSFLRNWSKLNEGQFHAAFGPEGAPAAVTAKSAWLSTPGQAPSQGLGEAGGPIQVTIPLGKLLGGLLGQGR